MGYIFDYNDALASEKERNNQGAIWAAEGRLMLDMLEPAWRETVLDIGCGTGAGLGPLLEKRVLGTGIDPSKHMLDIAAKNLGDRVDLHHGFAEDLPFDDNSFNYACLIKTLEFVDDPVKAIEEACRVAKDMIFIGVVNRWSVESGRLRAKGIFTKTVYNQACFFSIWELKRHIRRILGDVPICWKTAVGFPRGTWRLTRKVVEWDPVRKYPFGAFTGITATLTPRFRMRPLEIPFREESADGVAVELARTKWRKNHGSISLRNR